MADSPHWKEEEWQEVERLLEEQKVQAAKEIVEGLLAAAREAGNEAAWARALIRRTQLSTALHSYETAVQELRATPWPEEPLHRSLVSLFYGQALVRYLQIYSWEIQQRERVVSGEELDLKAWTREQIFTAAQGAFAEVWARREAWGAESIGVWAEYIEQNNYPARIRGTLRDAVSYLWADLMADSSLWEPEASQELYRLSLEELLSPTGPALTEEDLASPEAHPLRKVTAVLGDLEGWHRQNRRPEAAFEARRSRDERLHGAFSQEEDREQIRRDLARHLEVLGRRFEWWSMGRATLARMVEGRDHPYALAQALELALEGAEAHPESIGGQQCRSLAARIEAPTYELTAMASDGADRRSVEVQHKNLDRLYFRAYRLDLLQQVTTSQDYNLLPAHREIPALLQNRRPDAEWQVALPPTPDYRLHSTFAAPPLREPGLYVIAASARGDFADPGNYKTALNFILTGLVILPRQEGQELEVTVRSGLTGRALPGVEVDLYRNDWRRGHEREESRKTDEAGRVSFQRSDQGRNRYFVLARRGEDTALYGSPLGFYPDREQEPQRASLLFTDRSVYRPGQELLWKVITYEGQREEGRFRVQAGSQVEVSLADPNGEVVATTTVTTNDHGSASGSFPIPTGRLLGSWRLYSSLAASTQITVEEYKRPTFEVAVEDPEDPLRLNRPATLVGSVRYYFGLPVSEGTVSWQVTREPLYPYWWSFWGRPTQPPRVIAAGRTSLTPEGTYEVAFTPEADEREAAGGGVSYRYRLSVEVTDEGGETRSASRVFRLGFVAVEASIRKERAFFTPEQLEGEGEKLTIRRTNLDGAPRAGAGRWRLMALPGPERALLPSEQPLPEPPRAQGSEPEPYHTPGDRMRPRWDGAPPADAILRLWKDGAELAAGALEHGEDGKATLSLPALQPGAYRLRYTTKDAFGATFETQEEFLVARDGAAAAPLPAVLLPAETSVPVGGTARILVASGLPEQELVLEVFRSGRRVKEYRLPTRTDGEDGISHVVEIPITQADRGGFGVRLVALRDYQLLGPTAAISVPWDDRRLEVEFATFRDRLRPGQEETWRVTVKGREAGEETTTAVAAGAAELLAYMYDRSLDFFAPHDPPSPLDLYPNRAGAPAPQASLGTAGTVWRWRQGWAETPSAPNLTPDRLKFFDGYGIGGPGRRGPLMRTMAFDTGLQQEMVVAEAPSLEMAMADADGAPAAAKVVADPAPGEPPPSPAPPPPSGETPEVRENFAETAFWEPHLLTGPDGSVSFEFTVPDSVTEWNVWVHALTRDFRAGSVSQKVATVKELLVRPYLPRFLREGDEAEIKVVVNNAGEEPFSGELSFEIFDPETEEPLLDAFGLGQEAATRTFSVQPGDGANLTFPVRVPPRVGTVAFRVIGRAGSYSDGELRPLPVLPGRYHLAQSRFVTLRDEDRRSLTFQDLAADDDPTRIDDQLVVTIDAQLFYGVLEALPYLVEYPYECTEQSLNRFLATGIVTSLYDRYPEVAAMAKKLSARETVLESWDEPDPNRKMLLEETPWLTQSRGGKVPEGGEILNVLDPVRAAAVRRKALGDLEKAQTSLGGFPWWPGGPPSPYMTLYIVYGFSKALEHEVEVPREMVVRAWQYLHRHYLDEYARRLTQDEAGWEFVTFLNYVLSNYPDPSWTGGAFSADDREQMLAFSFRHWKQHSPLLKGYLALTLARAGRGDDARLVFDSILDSAKTDPDLGTYWAPEDRAWLWYNDTIETHAFTLRALQELEPADARRHGLVQWLFLNKKLNHWKSTRATAEVVYALVHYLEQEGTLGAREEVRVAVGPVERTFLFEPGEYTGKKNQVVIPGPEIEPEAMSTIVVEKDTPGFAFASATWHFSTERLPPEARGDFFSVTRRHFKRVQRGGEWVLEPLEEGARLEVGDQVEAHLSIRSKHAAEYVHLRVPRGAGFEPETLSSGYKWDLGLAWYEEVRDSGTNFFFEWLPAGEYTLKVRLRAALAGSFKVGPATLQSMYAPEFNAYSSGALLRVEGQRVEEP